MGSKVEPIVLPCFAVIVLLWIQCIWLIIYENENSPVNREFFSLGCLLCHISLNRHEVQNNGEQGFCVKLYNYDGLLKRAKNV